MTQARSTDNSEALGGDKGKYLSLAAEELRIGGKFLGKAQVDAQVAEVVVVKLPIDMESNTKCGNLHQTLVNG